MSTVAVLLYLLPVVALSVARARRDRSLWQIAVDIPLAVALDMMLLLALSRIVTLEVAAYVSKGVAVAGAGAWVVRRVRHGDAPAWPRELGLSAVVAAVASASALALVSITISRRFQIWDRFWHISLVPTIRTQTLPFANVYDPTGPLAYHYSGDALAASLQSLSGLTLHSSHALSLTHDLMFALSGATLGLLFAAWGARGWVLPPVAALAWVLTGPAALLRDDDKQWTGYNFVNYVTLSFRPHVSVAGLLIVGLVGAMASRLHTRDDQPRWREVGALLLAFTAALSVTDESSCAVLCVALGVAWFVKPDLLGPTRARGAFVLAALALSIIAANLLFAGLLAPGAQRPSMTLTAWRSPGFAAPTLPFSSPDGAKYFFQDVAALVLFGVAAVVGALYARTRAALAFATFTVVTIGIAIFALGRLHIPPKPVEAHRFVTAAMLVTPLFAVAWLVGRNHGERRPRSPAVAVLLVLGLVVPAASSFAWLRDPGKTPFQTQASFAPNEDFFETDCAEELGATYGMKPSPVYVQKPVFFTYVGCRPTFLAGKSGGHKIKTSAPLQGIDALASMRATMLSKDATIDAICVQGGPRDAVCDVALRGDCAAIGTTRGGLAVVRCPLTAADQAALLERRGQAKAPPEPPPAADDLDAAP